MTSKWYYNQIQDKVKAHVADQLEVAAGLVKDQAVATAPVGDIDGGSYRDGFKHFVLDNESKAIVTNTVEHAPYLEFGTGEFAENGQGRKGGWSYQDPRGAWHFTYGMKPGRYLRNALDDKADDVRKILSIPIK
jgi:hypothetical protein